MSSFWTSNLFVLSAYHILHIRSSQFCYQGISTWSSIYFAEHLTAIGRIASVALGLRGKIHAGIQPSNFHAELNNLIHCWRLLLKMVWYLWLLSTLTAWIGCVNTPWARDVIFQSRTALDSVLIVQHRVNWVANRHCYNTLSMSFYACGVLPIDRQDIRLLIGLIQRRCRKLNRDCQDDNPR
jgi:hypothetical protein